MMSADVAPGPSKESWVAEAHALRRAAPRHVLFLCVANSARSQMAEGIARTMAAGRLRVSSAGSAPSMVNPLAIEVMAEIGTDITGHRSTAIDDVDETTVDAVITLCAEEVCPVWPRLAHRLHWALPDPAAVTGSHEDRMAAFRNVRDELRKRLSVLLEDEGADDR